MKELYRTTYSLAAVHLRAVLPNRCGSVFRRPQTCRMPLSLRRNPPLSSDGFTPRKYMHLPRPFFSFRKLSFHGKSYFIIRRKRFQFWKHCSSFKFGNLPKMQDGCFQNRNITRIFLFDTSYTQISSAVKKNRWFFAIGFKAALILLISAGYR